MAEYDESIIERLIQHSRQKMAEGNPQQALAAVLEVVRLTQGEDAILGVLDNIKRQRGGTSQVDSMCSLLQEHCMIDRDEVKAREMCIALQQSDCLLSERGQVDILRDAYEDGSSIICKNCGDLVARNRWQAHADYWCSSIEDSS